MRRPSVRVRPVAPKIKALLRRCFDFIQSEGLICNRLQAYVISTVVCYSGLITFRKAFSDYIHLIMITCKAFALIFNPYAQINARGVFMKSNPLMKYSEQLAVEIEIMCKQLNKKENSNTIFQLRKSSSSVFANISEAQYPQSLPDMLSKFKIARKECMETESWLKLLYSTNAIDENMFKSYRNLCGRIRKLLTASCITIENKINTLNNR